MADRSGSHAHAQESGVVQVPFMDIQPNWYQLMRDPSGKFWISCRKHGEKSIHGYLRRPPEPTGTANGHDHHGEDKFTIRDFSQRTVTVECLETQCSATFVRPRKTLYLHDRKLLCMDVSVSGALGVCSSEDGRLWVWDADSGESRRALEGHVGDVYTCKLFPSGVVVLSAGADLRLKIWSAEDGSCPRTLTGHTRGISDTAIIDRGRNVVSVSGDGTARLWDCGSGRCLATLAKVRCPINSCALAASSIVGERNTTPPTEPESGTNDKLLLLACEDGTLRVCDVRNRNIITSCSGGGSPLSSCAFVSETTALSGAEDGRISLLDLRKTDQAVQIMSFGGSAVTSILPLGESRCLSACADGSCVSWNIHDPRERVIRLTGPEVDSLSAVKKAGDSVFTSCGDGWVRVYSIADLN